MKTKKEEFFEQIKQDQDRGHVLNFAECNASASHDPGEGNPNKTKNEAGTD